ncbi:hypothetical protein FLA_5649 [Filimonas lacunae]|nr:hypothetical protein FLA_5649 [Filimonas lacunae]
MLGLLQPDLADVAGISTRTIQLVEQGKGNPSLETLYKLIHPLGLTFKVELKSASENNKS